MEQCTNAVNKPASFVLLVPQNNISRGDPLEPGNIPIADEMWRGIFDSDRKCHSSCDDFPARYRHLLEKTAGMRPWKACSVNVVSCVCRSY